MFTVSVLGMIGWYILFSFLQFSVLLRAVSQGPAFWGPASPHWVRQRAAVLSQRPVPL